jgi:3-oxoacyl-ACP reductase-like protein
MGVFSSIMDKIFGGRANAAPAQAAPSMPTGGAQPNAVPTPPTRQDDRPADAMTPGAQPSAPAMAGAAAPPPASPTAGAATTQQVDVAAVLTGMAAQQGQKLDWKKSIVDLMKLVGIDSSLANRKELAKELGYTGDTNDSATMNVWLHKAVMRKLAENGGRVPAELKD